MRQSSRMHALSRNNVAAGALLVSLILSPLFVFAETDTTPPTISFSSSTPDPTGAYPIPVVVTMSEPVNGFEQSDIEAQNSTISNFQQTASTTYSFSLTPNGSASTSQGVSVLVNEHKFQDQAGNENQGTANFFRWYDPSAAVSTDTTAPVVTITSGPGNNSTTTTASASSTTASVTFEFTVDDAGATVECSIVGQSDADSFFGCGSPQNYTLPVGAYRFSVKATDQGTNTGQASVMFSIGLGTDSSSGTSTSTTTPPAATSTPATSTPSTGSGSSGQSTVSGGGGGGGGGGTVVSGPLSVGFSGSGSQTVANGQAIIPQPGATPPIFANAPSTESSTGSAPTASTPGTPNTGSEDTSSGTTAPLAPNTGLGPIAMVDGSAIAQNATTDTYEEPSDMTSDTSAETIESAATTTPTTPNTGDQTAATTDSGVLPGPWWVWATLFIVVLIIGGAWMYQSSSRQS